MVVQYSLELWEIPRRRNYVTASSLNRLDIECGKLSLPCLRIPERVVLGLEVSLKLFDAIQPAVFSLLSVRAAEAIWEWDEVGAVREMSETAAITIARRDGGRGERSSVIPAHESKNETFSGRIANDLQRIFDRLGAANVELHATLDAKPRFIQSRDCSFRCARCTGGWLRARSVLSIRRDGVHRRWIARRRRGHVCGLRAGRTIASAG